MFTPQFMEGAKNGLQAVRNYTYEAETALEIGGIYEAQKAMTLLVGQAINCQAVLVAKLAYELSQAERTADIPKRRK